MLYKSSVFSQASGSIGGTVFSHNRGGQYVRQRSTPTDPNTTRQQNVRAYFTSLSQRWTDTLTVAQRLGWAVYAASVPVINRLGDQVFLTGQNHYIRSNTPRLQLGLAVVDDFPYTLTLPTLSAVGVTVDSTADELDVTFDANDGWANEDGGRLAVYQSPPLSPTINFYKTPFQFAGTIDGSATTPPTSPATVTSLFDFTAGQKCFIQVRALTEDGRLSEKQITSGLAAAP